MNCYLHNLRRRLLKVSIQVTVGVAITLGAGSADAFLLLNSSPGGRLTMNLAMQALIGDQPVRIAMAQWNQVGIGQGHDHDFFVGQTAGTSGSCGGNQINEITSSDSNCGLAFGSSTLAVTTYWSSAGKVIEADIVFNNARSWSSYSGPLIYNGSGMVINDINRVALHELGHAAGLDHPDEGGQSVVSVMNSYIGDIDALQADDIAGAHAIAWQAVAVTNSPVCTLTTSPAAIDAGGISTLVASCTPAATSYTWANTGFGNTTSAGVVSPAVSTTYSVTGTNAAGAGNATSVTVSVSAVASLPDLEITRLTGPGVGRAGGQVTLMAEIRNTGGGTTSAFRVGYYLSRDTTVSSSDLLVGTCSVASGLFAGQTSLCTGSASIPANMVAATYFLRAVIDDTIAVNESDEANNVTAATPDVFIIFAAERPVCALSASLSAIGPGGTSMLSASCSPAATSYTWTNTGFGANVMSGMVSPAVTTTFSVVGNNAAGAGNIVSVSVSVAGAATADNYADLWWAGSAENGWGLSIQQHGNNLFSALYVYDSAGKPSWYVMPAGIWDQAFTTYSGAVYQPTSAPLNTYTPANFVPGTVVGNVTITFTSTSAAILRYVINGVSGEKAIQRQVFGHGVAPLQVGDMWWGGMEQDGWGISITQQTGILFSAWYTYGLDGRSTWYAMPNGTWSGTTYSGPFYSTTGSAWLGAAYESNALTITEAGTMSLNFATDGSAMMTYSFTSGPFAGTTQSRPIARQAF